MVDFRKLAIPITIILAISGVISFFLAYNFYPKKNVNINVDGTCYELLGLAFDQYKNLEAQKSIRALQLQLDAIEPPNAAKNNQIGNIDKYIVNGIVKKPYLNQILEDLKATDSNPLNRTVLSTVGLQPNPFITQQEGRQIAQNTTDFMQSGIRQIVEYGNTGDINAAECRTSTG